MRSRRVPHPLRNISHALRRAYGLHLYRHELRLRTWWRVGRLHRASTDPLATIDIDPTTVERYLPFERAEFMRTRDHFGVEDGDWDATATPLAEHFVYASLHARLVAGRAWEETPVWAFAEAGIAGGPYRYHGSRTHEQLYQRLEQVERLVERIRVDGYRSQHDIRRELIATGRPLPWSRPVELNEVLVAVGRCGDVFLVDGVHRLSIARLLAVPSIPVIVLRRHAAWQAVRDKVAREGRAAAGVAADHPDLRDVAKARLLPSA